MKTSFKPRAKGHGHVPPPQPSPKGEGVRSRIRALLSDSRGSSDLTVYMLLTAAGAAMVSLTLPQLWKSSDSAANTFRKQVVVLENGASPSGGGTGSGGGSDWVNDAMDHMQGAVGQSGGGGSGVSGGTKALNLVGDKGAIAAQNNAPLTK